jgi:hypothetical protein
VLSMAFNVGARRMDITDLVLSNLCSLIHILTDRTALARKKKSRQNAGKVNGLRDLKIEL